VIWRCECSAEIFVQCSGLNFEICMECKGLRTSSHHNTFEDMKFTPYLVPNSLLRDAPDYSMYTVSEFHAEAHRQLQVMVSTWRLERESNP